MGFAGTPIIEESQHESNESVSSCAINIHTTEGDVEEEKTKKIDTVEGDDSMGSFLNPYKGIT